MNLIIEDKKMLKFLRSQNQSIKIKYDLLKKELINIAFSGTIYQSLSGERLSKLESDLKVGFEIHSCKFQDRLRLVYEYHSDSIEIGNKSYEHWIRITDLANHEYKGNAYVTQFSE